MVLEEIIPAISKKYSIVDDPSGRAICGFSSGGICAFNVAWHRPLHFKKVAVSYTHLTLPTNREV